MDFFFKFQKGELLYDDSSPFPPDFIFDPGNEGFVSLDGLSTMNTWTLENPTALLEIINELLLKFRVNFFILLGPFSMISLSLFQHP